MVIIKVNRNRNILVWNFFNYQVIILEIQIVALFLILSFIGFFVLDSDVQLFNNVVNYRLIVVVVRSGFIVYVNE